MSASDSLFARSKIPLYLQVAGQFRLRIERGLWRPGQQLPVLEELQAELGLARVTIRQAFEVLEQQGYVRRYRGRGTFVADQIRRPREYTLPTGWDALVASLHPISATVLEGPSEVGAIAPAPSFDLGPDFSAWHLQRLHSIDERPYCLIDIFMRRDVFAAGREAFLTHPVILVLDRDHKELVHKVEQLVTFSISDEIVSDALGIELGQPVVQIERVIKDRSARTVLYTIAQFSGVDVRLRQDLSP